VIVATLVDVELLVMNTSRAERRKNRPEITLSSVRLVEPVDDGLLVYEGRELTSNSVAFLLN